MPRKITLNVSFILGDCKGTKAADKFSTQDFVIRYQHSNKSKQSASRTISVVCECEYVVSVLCNLQCPHNNLKVKAAQHKCTTRQMRIFGQSDTTSALVHSNLVEWTQQMSFFFLRNFRWALVSHIVYVFLDDSNCLEHWITFTKVSQWNSLNSHSSFVLILSSISCDAKIMITKTNAENETKKTCSI